MSESLSPQSFQKRTATLPPILFEDAQFIALDKPAGLLSIPGRDPAEPSLLGLLRARGADSVSAADSESLGQDDSSPQYLVVHRIDRETSGVILFAKNEEAHRLANGWFLKHEIKKEYLALAEGAPLTPAIRVNRPIEGKASLSQIQVVERFPGAFLARVRIASGRRHQIRIHLQAEGFPILGDVKYGGAKVFHAGEAGESLVVAGEDRGPERGLVVGGREGDGLEISRVALHAEKLVLPMTPPVEIIAPMPADFLGWCAALRLMGKSAK